MRLFFFLVILCPTLFTCKSVIRSPAIVGQKWVSLNACVENHFFVFDFSKQEVTTLENNVHRFKIKRKSFIIDIKDDSTLTFPTKRFSLRGDTLKILMFEDFEVPLIRLPLLQSSFSKSEIVDKMFELKNTKGTERYYMDFLTNEKMVQASFGDIYKDTITNAYRYSVYSVDSVNVVIIRDMLCNRFFVKGIKDHVIKTLTPQNNSLKEILLVGRPEAQARKPFMQQLIGYWVVESCSNPLIQKINTLRITSDSISVNENKIDKESGTWILDKLGILIMTNLENEWAQLEVNRLDQKLVIFNNGLTYVLTKNVR